MKDEWEVKKVVNSDSDSVWVKFGRKGGGDIQTGGIIFAGIVLWLTLINIFGIGDGLQVFIVWILSMIIAGIFLVPAVILSMLIVLVTLGYIIISAFM